MTEAESGRDYPESEDASDATTDAPRTKLEIPEPPKVRRRRRSTTEEEDRESRGLAAALLDWVWRHKLETASFLVTVLMLTALAVYLSIDPGPSRSEQMVQVGPPIGQDLDVYVETRKRALEDLADERRSRLAVVTFRNALTPSQLGSLSLPEGVRLEQIIVGDSLGYPEAIDVGDDAAASVELWRQARLEVLDRQRAGLSEILAGSPSPSPAAEWYGREAGLVDGALAQVRDGTVVLGAIVSGTGSQLIALQGDPSVLLVDPAPPQATVGGIVFTLAKK